MEKSSKIKKVLTSSDICGEKRKKGTPIELHHDLVRSMTLPLAKVACKNKFNPLLI
jgi:hypothetical protein